MKPRLEYTKITEARASISEIYNSAERHVPVVVCRDNDAPVAVIRRDDLKQALRALCPIDPQVRFAPDGYVSMWIDGLPTSGEGSAFEAAGQNLIDSLRDYSRTWVEDLSSYPNHKQKWDVVNLVLLSDDNELWVHMFGDD